MQELNGTELVEVAGLLVTLMIFFSIDAKFRFRRDEAIAKGLFRATSVAGGFFTALALVVVWIELFLPEDNGVIPVLVYFVPASLAILAALILAVEVTFLRGIFGDGDDDDDDGDDGEDGNGNDDDGEDDDQGDESESEVEDGDGSENESQNRHSRSPKISSSD